MSDKAERVSANAGVIFAAIVHKDATIVTEEFDACVRAAVNSALAIEEEVQKALRPKETTDA